MKYDAKQKQICVMFSIQIKMVQLIRLFDHTPRWV